MEIAATYKEKWRRWFVHGKLRFIGKPFYNSLIAVELLIERAVDGLYFRQQSADHSAVNEQLTVLIKTFERPKVLRRLVISIRQQYPKLKIIVVDDSHQPIDIDGVRTILMPFDSGVSAGRNEGLKHIDTSYALLLDDDFVFYRHTNLDAAVNIIHQYNAIDIMGGEVINLPHFGRVDYSREELFPTSAQAIYPPGSTIGNLPVFSKVANFFIARTQRLQLVGWDANLKRVDHTDFFTRAKGVLTTVYNAKLKCLHAPTPYSSGYMQKRNDLTLELALLQAKYHKPS